MQNVYRSTDLDASGWGTKAFSESEKKRIGEALTRKLGNDKLAQRRGPGGGRVTYLEGWQATELANEVFGYNGWSSRIMSLHQDSMECRQGRYVCCYSAVVRIQLKDGTYHEDIGVGTSDQKNKGASIQKAMKEAVTDGRKRALKNFGNLLGLCIYDKVHVKQYKKITTTIYTKATDAPAALNQSMSKRKLQSTSPQKQSTSPQKLRSLAMPAFKVARPNHPMITASAQPTSAASAPAQQSVPVATTPAGNSTQQNSETDSLSQDDFGDMSHIDCIDFEGLE